MVEGAIDIVGEYVGRAVGVLLGLTVGMTDGLTLTDGAELDGAIVGGAVAIAAPRRQNITNNDPDITIA